MGNLVPVFDHDASYFKLKEHERYINIAQIIVFISVGLGAMSNLLFSVGNGETAWAARLSLVMAALMFALNLYSYTKPFICILLLTISISTGTVLNILVFLLAGIHMPLILALLTFGLKLILSVFMVYATLQARAYEKLKEQMRLNR